MAKDKTPKKARPGRPPGDPRTVLAAWIAEQGLTQANFAAQLGVSERTIRDYCAGRKPPRPTQILIGQLTKGEVTYSER